MITYTGGETDESIVVIPWTAGAAVLARRVLMINGGAVEHYDPTVAGNYLKIIGMSLNDANPGEQVFVIMQGVFRSVGWGLTPDAPYYADVNGTINTVLPGHPTDVIAGVAMDADSLRLTLQSMGGGVMSVTDDGFGVITVDNTDPQNPVISFTGDASDIPVDDSAFDLLIGTNAQAVFDSVDDLLVPQVIGASFGGSGGVINITSIVTLISRYGGTITSWRVAGGNGETGSCVLDLKSGGVSMIGAGNKPTIVAGNTANAAVAGWTSTTLVANGIYEVTIDSLSTFRRLVVLFYFNRT